MKASLNCFVKLPSRDLLWKAAVEFASVRRFRVKCGAGQGGEFTAAGAMKVAKPDSEIFDVD